MKTNLPVNARRTYVIPYPTKPRRDDMFTGTLTKIASTSVNKGMGDKFKYGGNFSQKPELNKRFRFYGESVPGAGLSTNHVKEFLHIDGPEGSDTTIVFRTMSGSVYKLSAIREVNYQMSKAITSF